MQPARSVFEFEKCQPVLFSENWNTHKASIHCGHSDTIYATKAGRLTPRFFTGSDEKSVRIWNLFSRKLYHKIPNYHDDVIIKIDLACRERFMITSGLDQHLRMYDSARKHWSEIF